MEHLRLAGSGTKDDVFGCRAAAKSIAAEKNEKKIKGPRGKQFDLASDIRNIAKKGEKDVIPVKRTESGEGFVVGGTYQHGDSPEDVERDEPLLPRRRRRRLGRRRGAAAAGLQIQRGARGVLAPDELVDAHPGRRPPAVARPCIGHGWINSTFPQEKEAAWMDEHCENKLESKILPPSQNKRR